MLSITPNFTMKELEDDMLEGFNSIVDDIAQSMFEAGKKAVDIARQKTKSEGGFGNITWNLRSSIGCVLLKDHAIKEEHIYFPPIAKGSEGRQKGIDYAREIALLVNDDEAVLIFVAGMEYAGFVEGLHDYDVITGSSMKFDKLFKSLLT